MFGLSKIVLKSLILAVVGFIATMTLRFMKRGKIQQLETIETKEAEERKELMEKEWARQ